MALLKEARRLPGKEAAEPGLVDELIPVKGKKPVVIGQAISIMSASGLPIPVIDKEPEAESIGKIVKNELGKIFSLNNNNLPANE
jgi:hypothetical protein